MSPIGQNEKKTQDRVVKLFQESLSYQYLGDWKDRSGNANLEVELLRTWLRKQGHAEDLISRALYIFEKAVGDTGKSTYDRNRDVYGKLRYGIEVRPEIGANKRFFSSIGTILKKIILPSQKKSLSSPPMPRLIPRVRTSCFM